MVNTPYEKDTDLSPAFTANRRRRLLGRGSPERGAVARRRLRGRPVGPLPPQGIKIRRRLHPTKGRESPRRESDPPEAPCQANRKEGAGHNAPPARPLEPVPPQGQPPNQASSNHTLRLRLSPKQKNRAQAVQAALGERSPSD